MLNSEHIIHLRQLDSMLLLRQRWRQDMKRCFLLMVLAAVLFGCTAKTQPLPQTPDPETGSDVSDIPNNNEPI